MCDRELNGYRQDAQFPEYRKVSATFQAYNPYYRAWQPIIFLQPEKVESLLRPRIVTTPVIELDGAHQDAEFVFNLDPTVKAHLITAVGYPADVRCLLDRSQVLAIPRHVRHLILDWSLRLEKAGNRGDGLSFSQPEKEKAHRISINIHGNVGNLSNVVDVAAGAAVTARQTSTVSIDAESLSKLAAKLRQYADALIAPDRREQFRQALDAIESESQAENPNSGRLRQALTFVHGMVRDAAVSAGSGIVVQGALALITDVLGRLG